MARFVVMEPADALAGDAAAQARIVRDGFALLGFIFPPFWLLWHGLIIEAVLAFATMFGIAGLTEVLGLGPAGSILSLLLSIYVGLEGAALRLAALRRRGWREWGVLEADSIADAEIRYAAAVFDGDEKQGDVLPPADAPWAARPQRFADGPALGLFSYPGRS
ncbi:DUF2628 domain-containing protein [Mesorhizobium sp. LHD-90]|uniref:DUF2628 domain-containing protein n=1 Tax=Mesorhizobium sp. LHD-90 TaxID=3071414 RepID=UPI0027E01101|nr:DUF2628 domain-containing protein [Mesorhizobium sp. LHD-90]MDQ6434183.1 DUF2628 domain-containing protein [Mesorhizobium sp. LHD-90]